MSSPLVLRSKQDLRSVRASWNQEGFSVGFVPTMGALHAGHLELVKKSIRENDKTVVSIFVNPTQFVAGEDFDRYPRTFEKDLEALESLQGVDIVYYPESSSFYEPSDLTEISNSSLSKHFCGKFRPGHFEGVLTVVCKFFHLVSPTKAYFGEKDFQQVRILEKMVLDLDLDLEIVRCPTHRESDGLAKSSRNRYLSEKERSLAPLIFKSMQTCSQVFQKNPKSIFEWIENEKKNLENLGFEVQYYDLCEEEHMTPVSYNDLDLKKPLRIMVAVFSGKTRLIDNLKITH